MTSVRLQRKKGWKYEDNSFLKRWKPNTESEETGFGTMILGSLEDTEDLILDLSIEDITKTLPKAARAIDFDSTEGRHKLRKETKEHAEAEANLRVKDGDELKLAKKELNKQGRRYKARRVTQEIQKVKKHFWPVKLCIVKKDEQRVIGTNGRRSCVDIRGSNIRVRR